MSNTLNFRKARAEKLEDGKLWTPLDALECIAQEIREGKSKPKMLAIHWLEESDDGSNDFHFCQAGLNNFEHLALLKLAETSVIKRWQKL